MYPILSFDLDGTLVTSSYADQVWLEGLPKIYAQEKNVTLNHAKKILTTAYKEIGDHSIEWYDPTYWFKRYHLTIPWINLLTTYTDYITPYTETLPIIQQLATQFPLIIISNAKREFIEIQLKHTKLQSYFIHTFSSVSDFNHVKKEPHVYQTICNQLNIEPHQLIHIGDHKTYDYNVPRTLGIDAYYLNRTIPKPTHNHEVTSLTMFTEYIIHKLPKKNIIKK
ncbi:MAG: HAD family hydrolase [Candidatus Thermoplasmatota archaeon]|nr:HAD family hydrolase [Candidatus Thermoplasmatota archaeon]MBU1941962.1 HAD family hydrolase [Candidatus Thermoplasmatota archaeon]